MKYSDISQDQIDAVCLMYNNGSFMSEIYELFPFGISLIRQILINNNIAILNVSKRRTPKYAFKKGQISHSKGLKYEELYGEKAVEIKEKIGKRTFGKTWQEIHGNNLEDVKTKMHETRVKNKQKNSESYSISNRKKWKDGVYDNIEHKFYNIKWYDYNRNGLDIRLQGTWELEMAKRLDELGVDWICHSEIKERFIYQGLDGKEHTYKPDFKIIGTNIYIDPHWDFSKEQEYKFNSVLKKHSIQLKLPSNLQEIKEFNLQMEE